MESRWRQVPLLLSLLLLLVTLPEFRASHVSITNNGYEDVVVAFAPEVNESDTEILIANIKELFTSASTALYEATRQRSYFRQVTILIPQEWTVKEEHERASFETFSDADIRVDEPNPAYDDNPYTLQPQPCTFPGLYIHLTPAYLFHLHDNSSQDYGDPAKTLVHEWAHLRYGVFDEFGYMNNRQYPLFYQDEGRKDVPNFCTNAPLKGKYWDVNRDTPCRFRNGWPGKYCAFKPDPLENSATSSIASYHALPSVVTFCDDTEEHLHNKKAPNKHNALCNSRSTWDIVSNHPDFYNNTNPPTVIGDLRPVFRIVQPMEETVSVVLDASTSMKSPTHHPKEDRLREVVTRWLRQEVPLGVAVGLISFNEFAEENSKMKKLQSDVDRDELVRKLPNDTHGYTCIGCGLKLALQQLHNYRKARGGTIILLTDGEENRGPYIEDIREELQKSRVRVEVIAFTEDASNNLETIADMTNGKAYFVSLKSGVQALGSAFYDAITYQSTKIDVPIKIHDRRFDANDLYTYKGNFSMDSTLGKDTNVSFVYFDRSDIRNISIVGPGVDISLFTKNGNARKGKVTTDERSRLIKFTFEYLKPGRYTYTIERKGSAPQDITVTVTSKAPSKQFKPITTRCYVQKNTYPTGEAIVILAEVKQGMNPVVRANVFAFIETPNDKEPLTLQLFDNGSGAPDVTADDGIYSTFFYQFSGKGRYSVKAVVSDNGKTFIRESGFISSSALPVYNRYTVAMHVKNRTTGPFERVADGGSLLLTENINPKAVDKFPPARVTDLQVESAVTTDGEEIFLLHWTAPGDDYDHGTASKYIFCYSTVWEDVFDHFNGTELIFDQLPSLAGTLESTNFSLGRGCDETTNYLAMRSIDEANLSSSTSNVVQFARRSSCTTGEDGDGDTSDDLVQSVYVILSVLGISIMLVMASIIVYCLHRIRKTCDHYKPPQMV